TGPPPGPVSVELSSAWSWARKPAVSAHNYNSTATPCLHRQMPASTTGCWHLYLDACRHLRVDAGVRLLRYLPLDARAAPGPGVQDDPVLQAERGGAIVAQFPHPSRWVPRPTSLLHAGADCDVGE